MKKSIQYYFRRNLRKLQAISPVVFGEVISGVKNDYTVRVSCPFCGWEHEHFSVESGDLRICQKSIWPRKFYKIILPQTSIPLVEGQIVNGFIVVFCPICKKFHFHGGSRSLGETYLGRFIAHCSYGEYDIRIVGGDH